MSIVNDLRLIPNFLKINNSGSAVFSGSLTITNGITGSISATNSLISSSTQLTSSFELKGSGIWSSSAQLPAGIVSGSSQLSGTTIENLTITNLTTVNETASVLFSSGSNKFGDFGNDIHQFTGSVSISGSITTIGTSTATSFNGQINATNGVVSGSSQITYANISSIPAGIVSGSSQITYANISSIPAGIISGSSQLTTDFDTRYLNTLGDSVVSGSSQINGTQIASNTITIAGTSTSLGGTITAATILQGTGVVSGSSQITYASISSIPSGIISGSSQVSIQSTAGFGTYLNQGVLSTSDVRHNSLGIGMAASTTAGRIDASGDIVAYSTSDRRFKENITPIPNAIEKITKISGNTYNWKEENKDIHGFEGTDVGVIAQEIEAVLPQLVTTRETGYKAVKYDKLVALLIEGIKEQQIKIDNLTIVVENLKKQKGL